ncbi:MAG TPA: hypothetical protein ENI86_14965 [Acidimicrobiales bacterium]|nr:hypothetical protein [Acidimicrobiales bacterium]
MNIERFADWGRVGSLPPGSRVVGSDRELALVLSESRRTGGERPTVGLVGGDMWRTLGAPTGGEKRLRGGRATLMEVDAVEVIPDGGPPMVFVAHLVARRPLYRGRIVAVMNAEWHGEFDVTPRSHPSDGRVELLDADLPAGQKWKARGRLRTGTHTPHPDIAVRSAASHEVVFERRFGLWLDGTRIGDVHRVEVRVLPEALTVVV